LPFKFNLQRYNEEEQAMKDVVNTMAGLCTS
jgi:hypothetical protein